LNVRNKQTLLIASGLAVVFLGSCCLSGYLFFPYGRLTDLVVQEIEYPKGPTGERRASGTEIDIGSVSPTLIPGGATLEDVRIVKRGTRPEDEPLEVSIEEVTARIGIFSLLLGDTSVSFDAEIGGGTIEGEFSDGGSETAIEATIEEVDLAELGILRSLMKGVPIEGQLNGEIDLTVNDEPEDTDGRVDLTIEGLLIGDGVAKFPIEGLGDGITVEQIDAGDLTLALDVENGTATVETFGADGQDIQLEGEGTITVVRPLQGSNLNLFIGFKFSDSYRDRNDRTRGMFTMMDFTPRLRPARTPDGGLRYRLTGTIGGRVSTSPAGSR
jgi:type II secretion system protein N